MLIRIYCIAHWNEWMWVRISPSSEQCFLFFFSSLQLWYIGDWTTAQSINSWHDHLCAMLFASTCNCILTLIWLIYFHVNVCYFVNYMTPANYATAWNRWNREKKTDALNKSLPVAKWSRTIRTEQIHSRQISMKSIEWINKTEMNCTHIAHAAERRIDETIN